MNALNQIQKSIKYSKYRRKRGTGDFQNTKRTFDSQVRRSQNQKVSQKFSENTIHFEDSSQLVKSVQDDIRMKIPPHRYDSSSKGSCEMEAQP